MLINKNQKNFLLLGSLILITISLYSVIVYNIDYFREMAISVLLTKDEYAGIYPKKYSFAADIGSGLLNQSTSTPPVATSTAAEEEIQKKFEYKMVLDPDPCTLNKLGGDGWEISQISTADLDLVKGYNENCRRSGSFPAIPWILFIRKQ